MMNSKAGKLSDVAQGSDNLRPATDIHVLAGCQQPESCLRQQSQNQALNMGVAFYGDDDQAEIGNIQGGTDFSTYIHPTSRRNVREGLCRLGKDWTYYSGKLWHYDHQGTKKAGNSMVNTIELINSTAIDTEDTTAEAIGLMDSSTAYDGAGVNTGEATAVFGRNLDPLTNAADPVSDLLWGRGIYDAHDTHGHQFWHERESW